MENWLCLLLAKILMSGDVGAALEGPDAGLYVENFSEHTAKMKMFHQRWMPSNRAKNDWIKRESGHPPKQGHYSALFTWKYAS